MASIIRQQIEGIWEREELPNGQFKSTCIGEIQTKWTIAIYNGNDEIISITKNDEPTRTYRVKSDLGWAIRIRKTFIGSSLGATTLFDLFDRIEGHADYRYKFLHNIWDKCKPIKNDNENEN